VDALRLALTPSVNQMRCVSLLSVCSQPARLSPLVSVLGIISIPGMMTGALLGGASVQQAARLQMVIMFMISACTALASITSTLLALGVVVDGEARVRSERVDPRKAAVWRARDHAFGALVDAAKATWTRLRHRRGGTEDDGERARLLG
jgi:hypothetical protein